MKYLSIVYDLIFIFIKAIGNELIDEKEIEIMIERLIEKRMNTNEPVNMLFFNS